MAELQKLQFRLLGYVAVRLRADGRTQIAKAFLSVGEPVVCWCGTHAYYGILEQPAKAADRFWGKLARSWATLANAVGVPHLVVLGQKSRISTASLLIGITAIASKSQRRRRQPETVAAARLYAAKFFNSAARLSGLIRDVRGVDVAIAGGRINLEELLERLGLGDFSQDLQAFVELQFGDNGPLDDVWVVDAVVFLTARFGGFTGHADYIILRCSTMVYVILLCHIRLSYSILNI